MVELTDATGERVGCTIFVTKDADIAGNCESVMERLQRSEVSNPPAYGAKIANLILNNENLIEMWYADLITMCTRIREMREALYTLLNENGPYIKFERSLNLAVNLDRCNW